MTSTVRGIRSTARARRRVRPSIREVCLVGIGGVGESDGAGARSGPEEMWASADRVTWSGRRYRIEATQVRPGAGAAPLRYVHLAALAEG